MTEPSMTLEKAAELRAEFGAEHVGKLPKITCGACSKASGRCCNDHNKAKCRECDNYITERHTHLDYVGHGAVRDRLLKVDPMWQWEPLRFNESDGMPTFAYDDRGNPVSFWIKLTVCGVTRLGVGTCPSNQADAEKVLIGDALRNAAMSFGVALDLWIKGHAEDDERRSITSTAPDRRRREQRNGQARPAAPANGDAPPPHGEPAAPVTERDVAQAADSAFSKWGDQAPKGHKTRVKDYLRHALVYACTKGEKASLKDCTPAELRKVRDRCLWVISGDMTVTADVMDPRAGAEFSAKGADVTVLWAEVAERRGEELWDAPEAVSP